MDDKEEKLSGEFVLSNPGEPDDNSEKDQEETKQRETPVIEVNEQKILGEATQGIQKNNAGFLSSLSLVPKNIRFENQESDEEVILLVRRALITNTPWILVALLLIFLPIFVLLSWDLITPFINLSLGTLFVLLLFYYLMIFGFIIIEFTSWYFNVGLVTNKRVIDLDLENILHKQVSETKLNLIEDVSYSKVGSIRAFFDYGDVTLQTAGTIINFEFLRAPQPAKIVRIIADMIGGKLKGGIN